MPSDTDTNPTADPSSVHSRALSAINDADLAEEADRLQREHDMNIAVGQVIKSLHADGVEIDQVKVLLKVINEDYKLPSGDAELQTQIQDLTGQLGTVTSDRDSVTRERDALLDRSNVITLGNNVPAAVRSQLQQYLNTRAFLPGGHPVPDLQRLIDGTAPTRQPAPAPAPGTTPPPTPPTVPPTNTAPTTGTRRKRAFDKVKQGGNWLLGHKQTNTTPPASS